MGNACISKYTINTHMFNRNRCHQNINAFIVASNMICNIGSSQQTLGTFRTLEHVTVILLVTDANKTSKTTKSHLEHDWLTNFDFNYLQHEDVVS